VIGVSTTTPDNVTLNSATLRASLTAGRNIRVWFAFSGPNGAQPNCGPAPSSAFVGSVANSGDVQVSLNVASLIPGAQYRYRACAQNNSSGGAIVSGSSVRFTTNDAPTEVETIFPPLQIEPDSVRLEGRIISGTNVNGFFVLDDNTDISCTSSVADNSPVRNLNTGDTVDIELSQTNQRFPRQDLVSNTKYYYRFCADGSSGNDDEGMIKSFVTDGNGDAMSLDRTATRTDDSIEVTGRLNRTGQAKNTWFVVLEGNVTINDSNCSTPLERDRLGAKVLNNTIDTNVYTANDLDDNRTYTIGFCGEGVASGTGEVSLGGRRVFTTKRNADTVVSTECGTGRIFRSGDGPLSSLWVTQSNFISGRASSSPVTIRNFSPTRDLRWQILESNFAASQFVNRTVPAETERVLAIRPNLRGGILRYGVRIFSSPSDNWTAEFSCRNRFCTGLGGASQPNCRQGFFPL